MTRSLQFLCFDFGIKRFGVAAGNNLLRQGQALDPIQARDGIPDWPVIETLVNEWKPHAFIVGLPLNMDGTENEMCTRARKFGKRLKGRFNKEVHLMDERLSSYEARSRVMAQTKGPVDFGQHSVDGQAACLILETWFSTQEQSHEA